MFGKKVKYQPSLSDLINTEDAGSPEESVTLSAGMESETQHPQQTNLKTNAGEDPPATEGKNMAESDLTASVSKDTIFTGDIHSKDNIEIFGQVQGTIVSTAVVKIYGTVEGDISSGVMVANNAAIVGNIDSKQSVVIGNNTSVKGNIHSGSISISGQVDGNVVATESVSISSTGQVYGDISTPVMELCKGAIIFGAVVMEKPAQIAEPESPKTQIEQQMQTEYAGFGSAPQEANKEGGDLVYTSAVEAESPAAL